MLYTGRRNLIKGILLSSRERCFPLVLASGFVNISRWWRRGKGGQLGICDGAGRREKQRQDQRAENRGCPGSHRVYRGDSWLRIMMGCIPITDYQRGQRDRIRPQHF